MMVQINKKLQAIKLTSSQSCSRRGLNESLYPENFDYFNNSKRRFSVSNSKLSDIDKLLNSLSIHQEQIQKFKRELDEKKEREQKQEQERLSQLAEEKKLQELEKEIIQEEAKEKKSFSTKSEEKVDELIDKHGEVEDKMVDRLINGFEQLGEKKSREISKKYEDSKERIVENVEKRAMDLEDAFRGETKSVEYYRQKVDIEAARFKNITQLLEKQEKEIDNELKKKGYSSQHKEEYEKERLEWLEQHKTDVQSCRQEKKNVKEHLESNVKPASELVEDLMLDCPVDVNDE